ncbi:MAG: hypothetical protein Q4B58_02580, partial [Bacteroidales bacterium]|nr:hypothetical protein [Bacteroidales bacterium]
MKYLHLLFFPILIAACTSPKKPHDVTDISEPAEIYPEYYNVTVPCNIAPLNFLVRNEGVNAVHLEVGDVTLQQEGNKIIWPEADWSTLLSNHKGDTLQVTLTARVDDKWLRYPSLSWIINHDSVDSYITYRLIEPGYEVWHEVDIEERCLENFETRSLANGKQLGNRCMNCHTHGGDKGQYSYFYIRGKQGGTIVNRNGTLSKMTLGNETTG